VHGDVGEAVLAVARHPEGRDRGVGPCHVLPAGDRRLDGLLRQLSGREHPTALGVEGEVGGGPVSTRLLQTPRGDRDYAEGRVALEKLVFVDTVASQAREVRQQKIGVLELPGVIVELPY
jgi:hypothetical protein